MAYFAILRFAAQRTLIDKVEDGFYQVFPKWRDGRRRPFTILCDRMCHERMEMRFLTDEMLRGLARWLRVAGYDTAVAEPGARDRDLLARARREGRIFVTRDRRLVEALPPADDIVLLHCHELADCQTELGRRLGIDWQHRPFSRCLACNTPLEAADEADWQLVPPGARAAASELRRCPACRQLYWDGSHVARMRERLAELAKGPEKDG